MSRGVWGLPGTNKMKAYTKLAVVMCCPICDRRSLAPSSGVFCRRLQVTARAEAAGGGVAAGKMPRNSGSACSDWCRKKHLLREVDRWYLMGLDGGVHLLKSDVKILVLEINLF